MTDLNCLIKACIKNKRISKKRKFEIIKSIWEYCQIGAEDAVPLKYQNIHNIWQEVIDSKKFINSPMPILYYESLNEFLKDTPLTNIEKEYFKLLLI